MAAGSVQVVLPVGGDPAGWPGNRLVQRVVFGRGEEWFWDYRTNDYGSGPALALPEHHPLDQPVPGPAGLVPTDWQDHQR